MLPAATYLNKLCQDGMAERYPQDDGSLQKRMEYELALHIILTALVAHAVLVRQLLACLQA